MTRIAISKVTPIVPGERTWYQFRASVSKDTAPLVRLMVEEEDLKLLQKVVNQMLGPNKPNLVDINDDEERRKIK